MKFIVKPNHVAFHENVRWRAGEVVEIASIKEGDTKKYPRWGIPYGTEAAKKALEAVAQQLKDATGKKFAPSSIARAEALLNAAKTESSV